jgi:hypothetical protein
MFFNTKYNIYDSRGLLKISRNDIDLTTCPYSGLSYVFSHTKGNNQPSFIFILNDGGFFTYLDVSINMTGRPQYTISPTMGVQSLKLQLPSVL